MTKRGKVGAGRRFKIVKAKSRFARKDVRSVKKTMRFSKADLGDFWELKAMDAQIWENFSISNAYYSPFKSFASPSREIPRLTDVETIYRKRYLDLILNRESFERFVTVQKLSQKFVAIFWWTRLEVETPVLHNEAGGAVARPFITTTMPKHWHGMHCDLEPHWYGTRLWNWTYS